MIPCEGHREMDEKLLGYWHWFFRGTGGSRGFLRLVNYWIIIHAIIGGIIAYLVEMKLSEIAGAVLFPIAGGFVGLAFAWAVNAQVLMQSEEIEKLAEHHKGGFAEYVYVYQTAILTLLVTLVLWALAGLRIFDSFGPDNNHDVLYYVSKLVLFTLCSLSVRESWHVVSGTSYLLLIRRQIHREQTKEDASRK